VTSLASYPALDSLFFFWASRKDRSSGLKEIFLNFAKWQTLRFFNRINQKGKGAFCAHPICRVYYQRLKG
jgi:hypothetical protein